MPAAWLSAGCFRICRVFHFLQRSYDELIHDVSLQNVKVILAVDRAGVVGGTAKPIRVYLTPLTCRRYPILRCILPLIFKSCGNSWLFGQGGKRPLRNSLSAGKELYKPSYFESSLLPFTVYGPQTGEIALVTYGRIFSFAAETAELLGNLGYPVKAG